MDPVSTIRAPPWENLASPEKHPRVGDPNASGTTPRRMRRRAIAPAIPLFEDTHALVPEHALIGVRLGRGLSPPAGNPAVPPEPPCGERRSSRGCTHTPRQTVSRPFHE